MKPVRVAAVQMISTADVAANLAAAERLIAQAAAGGAALVVLPEAFTCADSSRARELGEAERSSTGPLRSWLATMARSNGITLVGGTIPIGGGADGRVSAACLLLAPDGTELARYDKIHLFDVELADAQQRYCESATYAPGSHLVTADLPFGRLGLTVCYDVRFPELYRLLAQRGVELLVVPSAFTRVTGEAHWHALMRARAIETQCYLIAPNQGGRQTERRESWGGSVIIDPWGRVLASAATGEDVLFADTDPALQADVRRRIPVGTHGRLRIHDPG
jgi:predicted amidohydrolase